MFVCILIALISEGAFPQSSQELDKLAQEYYSERDFTRAIETWMLVLEQEPENERIQKKIERVYEEKYQRDLAFLTAKKNQKLARIVLYSRVAEMDVEKSFKNYIDGKKQG